MTLFYAINPDDASTKLRKNTIFSSVAKNPVPAVKSSTSSIDFSETLPNFDEKPLTTTTKTESLNLNTSLKTTDNISKIDSELLPKNDLDTPQNTLVTETEDHQAVQQVSATKINSIKSIEPVREPGVLYQNQSYIDDEPATVAFNFEDANLSNLLSYMEAVHHIKFITDDIIPTAKDPKGVAGHKITFRTNKTLTRKESWDLCVTFLHIAGLDVVPMMQSGFYRLVSLTKANNEPIPTYIGIDCELLPDNDMVVRYVYFVKNIDPAKIQPILVKMQSGSAKLDVYADLKALIFTDRASSVKSLMKIVSELDHAALPEVLSVVKLKRTNAKDVISLYRSLKPTDGSAGQPQRVWANNKKESSLEYFPQDVVMVADERTNSLILLGTKKDVARIEEFITQHVDVTVDRDAPPIFTYRLQYTNAKDMTSLLHEVTKYGANTDAGKYGGVRDGLKYFQKMTIIADSNSNSLIINATPEDFEAIKPLIEELDVPQKQVGVEVLFVRVSDIDVKTLGAQISGPNGANSTVPGASLFGPTFMPSLSAQTSGVPSGTPIVVTNGSSTTSDFSIKSSLASLLGSNVLNEAGSVLVTFGKPIWAIFKILKTITSTHVITNPFVVVSNNCEVSLTSGQERRQSSGTVISSSAVRATGLVPVQATLKVKLTPTINKDNIINLKIHVENQEFNDAAINNVNGVPRDTKSVETQACVANGETLVLGGIMTENYASKSVGVPFLEHIPVLGWFFKSKTRTVTRDHFLIFICPRILDPLTKYGQIDPYTDYKLNEIQKNVDLIDESDWFTSSKDPIQKAFFGSKESARALQELRTGNNYAQREAIDGKIDKKETSRNKRLKKTKKVKESKKKKKQKENIEQTINDYPSNRMKNNISKGVSDVA